MIKSAASDLPFYIQKHSFYFNGITILIVCADGACFYKWFEQSPASLKPSFHHIALRYAASAVAGLLLALAFPSFGIAGFAWVAPALMLACAHGKKPGESFLAGYFAGFSFWLASLYWLLLIPVTGFPILGWLALSAFLGLFSGTWVWLLSGKIGAGGWTQRNLSSLLGAAAWVALEMFRARIFGGFPWSFIGVSQFKMVPLIQITSVTGVYGISFLVVWTSLCFFSAVRMVFAKPNSRFAWQPEIFLPLFLVAGLFSWGEVKLNGQSPAASTLRITLIQPSVPQSLIWDESQDTNRFNQLLALSESALTNQPDLLVWPEAAVPRFDDASYAAITNLVRTHHVWMIFNADDVLPKSNPTGAEKYDVFNSAFLFDPDGNFASVYHKQKLVIFGEYVPPLLKWFTPVTGSYQVGNFPSQFAIKLRNIPQIQIGGVAPSAFPRQTVNAAPLICFEDAFPHLVRKSVQNGTDFLVNLTNDGWFGNGAEQWQQTADAVFRAVENGVPLVRCCNNGVSCWIDAGGRVRDVFQDATGGIYGSGAMTFDLPLPDAKPAPTFYNRHGDWFGWLCVMVSVAVAAPRISRRKPSIS